MILEIDLLTLSMCVGLNNPLILTQYELRWVGLFSEKFLTMYDTYKYVSLIVIRNRFIYPIYGCGVKITPFYYPCIC